MTELEALLRRMAEGDVPCPTETVCLNLNAEVGPGWCYRYFDNLLLEELFQLWPECAEVTVYPIAGEHECHCRKFPWQGENGKKRKRLCLWLADLLALKDAGL